jgi:hypothetical protein
MVQTRPMGSKHYQVRNQSIAPRIRIFFDTIDLHNLRLRRQLSLGDSEKTRKLAATAYREEAVGGDAARFRGRLEAPGAWAPRRCFRWD